MSFTFSRMDSYSRKRYTSIDEGFKDRSRKVAEEVAAKSKNKLPKPNTNERINKKVYMRRKVAGERPRERSEDGRVRLNNTYYDYSFVKAGHNGLIKVCDPTSGSLSFICDKFNEGETPRTFRKHIEDRIKKVKKPYKLLQNNTKTKQITSFTSFQQFRRRPVYQIRTHNPLYNSMQLKIKEITFLKEPKAKEKKRKIRKRLRGPSSIEYAVHPTRQSLDLPKIVISKDNEVEQQSTADSSKPVDNVIIEEKEFFHTPAEEEKNKKNGKSEINIPIPSPSLWSVKASSALDKKRCVDDDDDDFDGYALAIHKFCDKKGKNHRSSKSQFDAGDDEPNLNFLKSGERDRKEVLGSSMSIDRPTPTGSPDLEKLNSNHFNFSLSPNILPKKGCLLNNGFKLEENCMEKPKEMKMIFGCLPLDVLEQEEEDRISAVKNYHENLKSAHCKSKSSNDDQKRVQWRLTEEQTYQETQPKKRLRGSPTAKTMRNMPTEKQIQLTEKEIEIFEEEEIMKIENEPAAPRRSNNGPAAGGFGSFLR